MSRWFRLYDDLVDDPKIQRLPGETVKALLNLWCLASQNDGLLPAIDDIAFKLRMKPSKVEHLLSVLGECGLIDSDEMGLRPHNWNARQYKSDVTDPTAASRQKAYRDRIKSRDADRNGTVTNTDTRTDTEQSITDTPKPAAKPAVERNPIFDELRRAYPKRKGGDPGPPAAKLFLAAIKAGTDAQTIIDGAKRFAVEESQNINTPYIPQLVKWLRDKRWLDYSAGATAPKFDIRSSLI
jgi:DNA-binding transcriptional ArsR family regulator